MLNIKNLDLKYQNGFSLVAKKLGIELKVIMDLWYMWF